MGCFRFFLVSFVLVFLGLIMMDLGVNDAIRRHNLILAFIDRVLVAGRDYGNPVQDGRPAFPHPILYKPGAERLANFLGLSVPLDRLKAVEDWTGSDYGGGEPLFAYTYRASAFSRDCLADAHPLAVSDGFCSSRESKYRYRKSERSCPSCSLPVRRGKDNFYCWIKTGGCGKTFSLSDRAILDQAVGLIPNPDILSLPHTISRVAQKRAYVGVVILAGGLSAYFADSEPLDYIPDPDFQEIHSSVYLSQQQQTQKQHKQQQSEKERLSDLRLKLGLQKRDISALVDRFGSDLALPGVADQYAEAMILLWAQQRGLASDSAIDLLNRARVEGCPIEDCFGVFSELLEQQQFSVSALAPRVKALTYNGRSIS